MNARRWLALMLLALLPLATLAAPGVQAPVAGVDYIEIADGVAFAPAPGRIEVVEVFGYTCGHCAHFEPRLTAWAAKLPDDVRFTAVAAPLGGFWIPYARAYFAAQALGLAEATHAAMFRALHDEHSLPLNRPSPEEIAGFYAGHGADPQRFVTIMASPQVDAALERARGFVRRSGVEGTPTLIVNGKYRVIGGRDHDDVLRITEYLIQREREIAAAAPKRKPTGH